MSVTHWDPSPRRPRHFPAGLPFVPNAPVDIHDTGTQVIMHWPAVDRPHDLLQQLIGASAKAGWTRAPEPDRGDPSRPRRRVCFRHGGAERLIEVTPADPFSFVSLTQHGTPAGSAPPLLAESER